MSCNQTVRPQEPHTTPVMAVEVDNDAKKGEGVEVDDEEIIYDKSVSHVE